MSVRVAGGPAAAPTTWALEKFGSMRETLEGLLAHAGTSSKVKSVPMRPAVVGMQLTSALGLSSLGPYHALMYGRSMYFDIQRAKSELDFAPRYSNVEMFCQSYDWYVEQREQVLTQHGAVHHRSAVKQGVLDVFSRLL